MNFDEALQLPNNAPICLADGKYGIVIRWNKPTNEIGIQVPGEDDIRWLNVQNVTDVYVYGGALVESVKSS